MASTGKRNQGTNGGEDFPNHPVGGIRAIGADELPNFVEINAGLGVERVSGHEPGCNRRAAALLSRK